MYLDFMDCPPTMNGQPGNIFPEKATERIQRERPLTKDAAAPSMGELDDGSVMLKFQKRWKSVQTLFI